MSNFPAHDLATALASGSAITLLTPPSGSVVVGYAAGVKNILRGPERESDEYVANQLINVVQTGGPPPAPLMGSDPNDNIYQARVQVMIRSQIDDFAGGEALARAALHKLHLVVISGYIDVTAQESEPNFIGVDERRIARWSSNFLMRWKG